MRAPATAFPDDRQGQPSTRLSRRSVVGRAIASFGFPAYSPVRSVRAAANCWRTTYYSTVKTRNPGDNSRIKSVVWSSCSRYIGVNDRGCPFSQPYNFPKGIGYGRSARPAPARVARPVRWWQRPASPSASPSPNQSPGRRATSRRIDDGDGDTWAAAPIAGWRLAWVHRWTVTCRAAP